MGLECLEIKDTPWLHKYLKGEITEKTFLEKVKWDEKWGFPWENYKGLIQWVHSRGGIIYGVNKASMRVKKAELKGRDKIVGHEIAKLLKKHSKDLVIVVFGELHLAKNHLLKEIFKNTKAKHKPTVLKIFQNPEEVYFKFLSLGSKVPQLVRKNKETFAILNVPPWVKWQTYLIYLEQTQDLGLHDDDEWDDEDSWDFSDEVAQMARILATDLEMKFDIGRLAVVTLEDAGLETALQKKKAAEKKILRIFIKQEVPFLLPENDSVYLPRMSVNHAAQAAMLYLGFIDHTDLKKPWRLPQDFLKLIWIFSWIYFGSKVLNPRRKTDTFNDLKIRLKSVDEKGFGKEALKIALYQKSMELSGRYQLKGAVKLPPSRNMEGLIMAAQLLGKIQGEKLYAGWVQRKFSKAWIPANLEKLP